MGLGQRRGSPLRGAHGLTAGEDMDDDEIMGAVQDAALRHVPDTVATYTSKIDIRGQVKPVLILSVNEFVGWVWVHKNIALWGSGSLASGKADITTCVAGSVLSRFSMLAELVGEWYREVRPITGRPGGAPHGTAAEFVRCIENGETPPLWPADAAGHGSTPQDAAPLKFNPYFHTREKYPPAPGFTDADLDEVPLVTVRPAGIPAAVGGFFLLIAFLGAPYAFYEVVRWVGTAMAVWCAVVATSQKRTAWAVAFSAMAVLFNPLIPIYLTRETWAPLDAVAFVLFATAGVKLRASRPATPKDGPTPITG